MNSELEILKGAMQADDERLRIAAERVGIYAGCDAPEMMADMIEEKSRLMAQYKAELDLTQEVIVNLRRDLANAHKRIESQDAVWNDAITEANAEVGRMMRHTLKLPSEANFIDARLRRLMRELA